MCSRSWRCAPRAASGPTRSRWSRTSTRSPTRSSTSPWRPRGRSVPRRHRRVRRQPHVTAPEVYWDWCGPHVICMERMSGVPMDQFDLLAEREIDGELVLRRGIKVWTEAALVHGPFHGDVHAGNLWLLDDGRSTYLDFGIMGELSPEWKAVIRDLLFTSMIDQDYRRLVRAYQRVGVMPPGDRPGGRRAGHRHGDGAAHGSGARRRDARRDAQGEHGAGQGARLHDPRGWCWCSSSSSTSSGRPGARPRLRAGPGRLPAEEHLPGGGREAGRRARHRAAGLPAT